MEVATHHAKAVGKRAGIGVEERFLLDRIALGSGGVTPRNVELAASVEANLADAGLAIGNRAAVATGETAQAVIFEFFDQARFGFANSFVEDGAEGGHKKPCIYSNAAQVS